MVKDNVKNYEDLPTVLVRAIDLMKMFNGTFVSRGFGSFGEYEHTVSIVYDGESWNFKSFKYYAEECYCSSCCDPEDTRNSKIREGQILIRENSWLVDFFFNMLGWEFDTSKYYMKVKVGEDGTSALVFNTVSKDGSPGTLLRSLTRSSDGNLVLQSQIGGNQFREEIFLPTNESVEDEEVVAATYASSVACTRDEYDSESYDDE